MILDLGSPFRGHPIVCHRCAFRSPEFSRSRSFLTYVDDDASSPSVTKMHLPLCQAVQCKWVRLFSRAINLFSLSNSFFLPTSSYPPQIYQPKMSSRHVLHVPSAVVISTLVFNHVTHLCFAAASSSPSSARGSTPILPLHCIQSISPTLSSHCFLDTVAHSH